MTKPVILTGLRANNDLHLGNYLGALLPMVDLANKHAGKYQINLFVPDLHSFTTPTDHSKLFDKAINNLKVYAAAGLDLDNPDVHIYRQSFVPAHSELTIILNCFTGFGEMRRMTQFKDKSAKLNEDRVSVGLFDYPVLMAADILLYGASYVPVGDDQTQHIEFTRDIAERMNRQFGELFVAPYPIPKQHEFFHVLRSSSDNGTKDGGKDQGLRIRDLIDPTKKMSKSDETGRGVIFLSDSVEEARKKLMSATTDSLNEVKYDYAARPGISNLLDVLKLLGGNEQEFIGQKQYGPLKQRVDEVVTSFLSGFQKRLGSVDEQKLLSKLESSEKQMNAVANQTLLRVQKAVGLRT